jgi:L-cysteate sulfo-lyase
MSIFGHLPRHPLAFLPTPLHPLPRLSALLRKQGVPVELWIKRDDQTGLGLGGNKTRKLEFLLAGALAQGADTLITTGAVQSNHCRQTAAAAARAGLACHLVLGGQPPQEPNGNLLLDMLFGAEVHWTSRENRLPRLEALAAELKAAGNTPYFITYGGSDRVGASGYAVAVEEALAQARELGVAFDAIVFASSSGGTHAGLVAGSWALGSDVPVLGISIDEQEAALQAKVAALATDTALHIGFPRIFKAADILVDAGYLGGGYGIVGELEREAVRVMAQAEGIVLDPVYTGRAFGGLLDILRRSPERLSRGEGEPGERGPRVLFWHTGGAPALFAYAEAIR